MAIDNPNKTDPLPSGFLEAYRWALYSVLRGHEADANVRLKHAFSLAAPGGQDKMATEIHKDLQAPKRQEWMYGDYNSNSAYPWINDVKTLTMIARHAAMLGEDKDVVQQFFARTEEAYKVKHEAPALRIVA